MTVGRSIIPRSILTCPYCGSTQDLAMPENACVVRHNCAACGKEMRPKAGDCCVFCSYGSVPCPPIQAGAARSC